VEGRKERWLEERFKRKEKIRDKGRKE